MTANIHYADMTADVLQTLDRLSALPAILLGHSMGGKVAMQAALTHAESVARLIVADIAPITYPPHYRDIANAMLAMPLAPGMTRAEADAALTQSVPDAAMRAFLLQNLQLGRHLRGASAWARSLLRSARSKAGMRQRMRIYSGPTLFVAGATSNYIKPEHRPIIRSRFPSARFVTLKNAGHWLHADNPSGFIAVIEAFLTMTS